MMGVPSLPPDFLQMLLDGEPSPTHDMSNSPESFFPDTEEINKLFRDLPPDPMLPIRPRPSTEMLISQRERLKRFWRPRNIRMASDEQIYKMQMPVEDRVGGDEIGASETMVLNDPYVLVEKVSNMISAQEPVVESIPMDPGLKDTAQKVKDFLAWWRDEAGDRWSANLNNSLSRDEVYYLALRGWIAARIMLDPGDHDFPYRFDLIDPMSVYPQKGPKDIRCVWHVYQDSKINVLSELGWDNDVFMRIEEGLMGVGDEADIEVSCYYDDVWHIMFINDVEVWSASHNYGFVPWQVDIAFGPPIRKTDPEFTRGRIHSSSSYLTDDNYLQDYTAWWGVSVFQGIKDVYNKLNKVASAILTEAMKAPNPPIVLYTNSKGEAESKQIDTGIGATNYLLFGQEEFKPVEYGFRPTELVPLMELLKDARNRGALPSVMYGEGANYLSGFAVNLLQAGSRDIILPLIDSHQRFLKGLFKKVLRLTAEIYPFPINMVSTDPMQAGRAIMTTITADEIKQVGYSIKVKYSNVMPQDKAALASVAGMLVDKKLISLDTARGEEYINLRNPTLENRKVLGDLAYFNQGVVDASIGPALLMVDPVLFVAWSQAKAKEEQEKQMMMQMQMASGKPPSGPPSGGGGGGGDGTAPAPSTGQPPAPPRTKQIQNGPGL
jgi:hypothetical protein